MVTSSATQYLNRFSNLPTVRLWNSSIREAVIQSHSSRALLIFSQMKQSGLKPDNFTLLFVAKACSQLSCFESSKIVHTQVLKSRFRPDVFVLTAVVNMYVKCNELRHAREVFERIPGKDTTAWNSMIAGYSQSCSVERVFCLFARMRLEGIRPDSVTIIGLTQSASHLKSVRLLESVHSIAIRIGLDSDVSIANTWIGAYAKCDNLELSKLVFAEIDPGSTSLVTWNSMIEAYSRFENSLDVMDCYKRMLAEAFRPDSGTIVSLLSSCSEPEAIHTHAIRTGCDSDISVANTLISVYSKRGNIICTRSLFNWMPQRTRVSWNVMISAYAERNDLDEALKMLHSMEAAGERPDQFTLVPIVSACGRTGELDLGKQLDSYAGSRGLRDKAVILCNALIDMFAKCGSLDEALEIFRSMPEKTEVSWTTAISGCALNGRAGEALELFSTMVGSGVEPNRFTFLSVLQGCAHAGMLEKGVKLFEAMTKVYNITPSLEHYSCLVDLFGRKGRTKEALDVISMMPVKPDVGIWSSLLSSCRIHRDVEVAQEVSLRLMEMDPTLGVSYVEMANLYASVGDWGGVAATLRLMKCNNAKKSRGQSMVAVDGKPRGFSVQDCGHPEVFSICMTLNSLMSQLEDETYLALNCE